VKPEASQPHDSLSQLLCRKQSDSLFLRVVNLSGIFQWQVSEKISALLAKIKLTGQSDVFGQSAQSIG
jgi:hypothetical protein